jgi:3' terminal RNA ribose 2'-O-methyltransferase Hen1
MILTIATGHRPATDLGYLLHKHPGRVQRFSLPFGAAHVFYPEASEERCKAALLLDVDPVGLVRRGRATNRFALAQYVNDRPYAASSLMSVALVSVFKSAMAGTCKDRPELAASAIPLRAELPAVPSRGGAALVRRLFEPLGYVVEAEPLPLDPAFPDWGEGRHVALALSGDVRLADLLNHLYVLLPVLDDDKHYWVGADEIDKLLRRGEGWLAGHPERELITRRYLKHFGRLYREAMVRLADEGELEEVDGATAEEQFEERVSLNEQRLGTVQSVLKASGARRVLDLGCGEGRLLERLLRDGGFDELVGVDVSTRALDVAERRLKLERLPDAQRERVRLLQSALTYRDSRLAGYDAAALVEVIEHLDAARLDACEANVFGAAKPRTVVVTTPNREYNVRFEKLEAGRLRHPDHRFEWTREEFRGWAGRVGERFGYEARFLPVGPEDGEVGPPTQMAVFERGVG